MERYRGIRLGSALALLMALMAGCADDESATPTPTTTPTTTPSTTPSTTAPTTTSPPTTTTTTVTTTTAATVTQDVASAYIQAWEAFNEAKLDPLDEAKVEAALAAVSGPVLETARAALDEYRSAGFFSATSSYAPAAIEVTSVSVSDDGQTAVIVACELNSNVLVERGSGPNGEDAVVDDSVVSHLVRSELVRSDVTWLVDDARDLAVFREPPRAPVDLGRRRSRSALRANHRTRCGLHGHSGHVCGGWR